MKNNVKKLAIFGATGGIGKLILKHALERGYEVNAYVRSPEKIEIINLNLHIFVGQVVDYQKIKEAISGCDAVINALGISMKFGQEDTSSIVAHKNIINAMQTLGIKRLIDWSTPTVNFNKDINSFSTIAPGIISGIFLPQAKKTLIAVCNLITSSNLDWTIVRFMAPKDTMYTGKVKVGFGDVKMKFKISREDIAVFMLKQVENNEYIHSMPIIGS